MLLGARIALEFDYFTQRVGGTKRHAGADAEGRRASVDHHYLAATALTLHQHTGAGIAHSAREHLKR